MSDYFGALMRSGGLSVGAQSQSPAPATALGRVEAGVVEVEVERSPAVVASAVAPAASAPQPASAPAFDAHPASALAPPAVPTPEPAADVLPLVQARLATPLQAELGVAASAAADPLLSPAATSAAEPPNPPLGQTLVRAAMQWVAADPMQSRGIAKVVPPSSSSGEAITTPGRSVARARPLREAAAATATEAESDAQGRTALAHPAALPEPSPREPVPAPALTIRPARLVPMAPPELPTPLAHDELVEVSIGAIHLRVDAPAAQTIARPAPAPAAAPRAPALAPRSALSRRALRRI